MAVGGGSSLTPPLPLLLQDIQQQVSCPIFGSAPEADTTAMSDFSFTRVCICRCQEVRISWHGYWQCCCIFRLDGWIHVIVWLETGSVSFLSVQTCQILHYNKLCEMSLQKIGTKKRHAVHINQTDWSFGVDFKRRFEQQFLDCFDEHYNLRYFLPYPFGQRSWYRWISEALLEWYHGNCYWGTNFPWRFIESYRPTAHSPRSLIFLSSTKIRLVIFVW